MIQKLVHGKMDSHSETIWLTIYADLITNLVLLFLALYGLTVMGDDALAKAIQSMKIGEFKMAADPEAIKAELATLLRDKFEKQMDVTIREEVGAVRLEFGENVLFDSGQASLKKTAIPILADVAELLKTSPSTIVVEGHTDSVPLRKGAHYKDNWELSLGRSMSVVHVLIDKGGIKPVQVAAAAYGETKPRASNLTKSGRKLNRRVEIALFKEFPYEKGTNDRRE